jgi:PAS domain-containing protein
MDNKRPPEDVPGESRQTKRSKSALPGTTHANVQLLKHFHEKMWAIYRLRHLSTGHAPSISELYEEAVSLYFQFIDWVTGKLKPQATASPIVPVVVALNLPVFGLSTPVYQLEDDDLVQKVDRSEMMVWVATPEIQNQHASPLLVGYTGRTVADFATFGWKELLHPDDREKTMQRCRQGFATRQPFRFCYRLRRLDGVYGWIMDHAVPRYRPDGTFAGYCGTLYELTFPGTPSEVMLVEIPNAAGHRWPSDGYHWPGGLVPHHGEIRPSVSWEIAASKAAERPRI